MTSQGYTHCRKVGATTDRSLHLNVPLTPLRGFIFPTDYS